MTESSTQSPSGVPSRIDGLTEQQRVLLESKSPATLRYLDILNKSPSTYGDLLRQDRLRSWCDHVLEIYFGANNPEMICKSWSLVADQILVKAWKHSELEQEPIALFAMGKLGAKELNLSSDVDLIAIQTGAASLEAAAKIRRFTVLLQQITDFGFCFRVDFDLRPGGSFSPLIPSIAQIEDHYWQRGETWERLALVRARPILGPTELIQDIQNLFHKFSFRKFIDFTLLRDLEQLRSKIFFHREVVKDSQFNLKLIEGGIRDIELFINSLQVINGGRVRDLQVRGIREAGDLLKKFSLSDPLEIDQLVTTYWKLRDLENRAQAVEDRQTHVIEKADAKMVYPDLENLLSNSFGIVNRILGHVDQQLGLPPSEFEQRELLNKLGLKTDLDWSTWTEILGLTARSSRHQHDEGARQKALFQFINEISKGLNPTLGLQYLSDFFKSTRAKSSFFTLLLHSPGLVRDLSRLFSSSPYLAQLFVARPELLEPFILNATDNRLSAPDVPWDQFLEALVEEKLVAVIKYSIELLSGKDLKSFHSGLSDLADRVSDRLLRRLLADYPDSHLRIMRLGRWGACEMGIKSDLDFIFISDMDPTSDDLKLSRRFISRLTEPHKGGGLYPVDLRLRPSGSSGPMILNMTQLSEYLKQNAAPWERQSYLRCRLDPDSDKKIRSTILERSITDEEIRELALLRKRLRTEAKDPSSLKYIQGGLVDTEYAAQVACIRLGVSSSSNTFDMINSLQQSDTHWKKLGSSIAARYDQIRQFEQLQKLLGDNGDLTYLSQLLHLDRVDLAQKIDKLRLENYLELKELDPVLAAE